MVLDYIKTTELTSIGNQLLKANSGVVETVLNTSQNVVKNGVEYNRSVIQAGINALSRTREESGRLVDEVISQGRKVEERTLETLEEVSDKSKERVAELFDRIGNPAATFGNAFETSVLDSVQSISEPSVTALKSVSEQLTEVPNTLLRTAAIVEEKVETKPAAARKTAAKA